MRVISGFARGKKLFAPKDQAIRPTSDRVKESLFNILAFQLRGKVFVDLFCGSGAMGIEALSRGCRQVYFFDKSRDSIQLTKKNLDHCGFSSQEYVVQWMEYQRALDYLSRQKEKVDFFFMDPPYAMKEQGEVLKRIVELDLLAQDGWILLEYDVAHPPFWENSGLTPVDQRQYGNTGVLFFRNQVMT